MITTAGQATDPRFMEPLELEYIDGKNYKVISEFDYHTDVALAGLPLRIVPIHFGFLTDFASVPKILWNIFPPTGRYGKAALVHDFLYRTSKQATKAQADSVFFEAMTALGVGTVTRRILYYAVHLFGGSSYKGGL